MTTSFLDISAALDSRLNNFSSANSISVAWENKSYKPTVGVSYLSATLLPADSEPMGVGNSSAIEHLGVYQVNIFTDADKGKGAAIVLADKLATYFPRGNLTYNDKTIRIRSVSRGSGARDGAWYVVPVSISYQSFT